MIKRAPAARPAEQTGDKAQARRRFGFWLTNTGNSPMCGYGARMKLVGGDSGRVEHESLIVQVLLAPSERRRRSTVRYQ
jgi:hypothetical protein